MKIFFKTFLNKFGFKKTYEPKFVVQSRAAKKVYDAQLQAKLNPKQNDDLMDVMELLGRLQSL